MAVAELRRGIIDRFFRRQPDVLLPETTGERTPERQFVDAIDAALYRLKQRDPNRQTFRSMHSNRIDFGHRDVGGKVEHFFAETVDKMVDEDGEERPANPFTDIYETRKGVLSHSRKNENGVVQLSAGNQVDVNKISAKLETIVK